MELAAARARARVRRTYWNRTNGAIAEEEQNSDGRTDGGKMNIAASPIFVAFGGHMAFQLSPIDS